MKRIRELYQEPILEHSRHPFHEKVLENANITFTAYNPLCGDKFTFYVLMEEDKVVDASFMGYGCQISKASSSVLVKNLIGRSLAEVRSLVKEFLMLVDPHSPRKPEDIFQEMELLAFSKTREFPERIECARLGWSELQRQLENGDP